MPRISSASRSAPCATSSTNTPTADCRSRPRAPANINGPPRRCDQRLRRHCEEERSDKAIQTAFPRRWIASLALAMTSVFLGVIGRVGLAEDVDRIARLQVAPGECRIGIEREIADRERADRVERPDRDAFHSGHVIDAFHQVTPARPATAAGRWRSFRLLTHKTPLLEFCQTLAHISAKPKGLRSRICVSTGLG